MNSMKLAAAAAALGCLLWIASIPAFAQAQPEPSASPRVELPSGIVVEVLGVTAGPKSQNFVPTNNNWWSIDGTPMAHPPEVITKAELKGLNANVTPPLRRGSISVRVAFRVSYPPKQEVISRARVNRLEADGSVEINREGSNIEVHDVDISAQDGSMTLYVELGAGPWVTQGSSYGDAPAGKGGQKQGMYLMSRAFVEDDRLVFFVADTNPSMSTPRRVVVTGDDGKQQFGRFFNPTMVSSEGPGPKLYTARVEFAGLPLKPARQFLYQIHPYDHRIEFKDVAIEAGKITTPRVTAVPPAP